MTKYRSQFRLIIFIIITLIFSSNQQQACTSFAVYSSNIYYGLNLDWPNAELRFSIQQNEGFKYFQLDFYDHGNWINSVGFNVQGLVCTFQMVEPGIAPNILSGETPIDFGQLYRIAIENFENADNLEEYLSSTNYRLYQIPSISLHSLIAARDGRAFVAESGVDSNMFTYPENNFLVMANFNNHKFWGKPYNQVTGLGADRYKAAYQYISDNFNDFSFEDAFETLKKCKQSSGSYKTLCSLVFDPANNDVYFVIKRDYQKIFKISLNENSLETYSGFDNYIKLNVDSDGVLSSDLITLTDIANENIELPSSTILHQNYPNPFNPETMISWQLAVGGDVELKIFDILGIEITTLIDEYQIAGIHHSKFSTQQFSMPSGIYFCRLRTKNYSKTIKILLTK
ncbi:MAG: T9SS type A sorting domain-containing protein [bacterium]